MLPSNFNIIALKVIITIPDESCEIKEGNPNANS